MIVTGHGLEAGTVGGGKIENHWYSICDGYDKELSRPFVCKPGTFKLILEWVAVEKSVYFLKPTILINGPFAIFGVSHLSKNWFR